MAEKQCNLIKNGGGISRKVSASTSTSTTYNGNTLTLITSVSLLLDYVLDEVGRL